MVVGCVERVAMIYESTLPDVEIPKGISITDYSLRLAEELADKPAIIDGPSGRTETFGQLKEGIQLLAGGLAARGFGPGQTLALMAPNIPEYASFFHGAAYAGGTVTTINPTYTAGEVQHQLHDSQATILVTISMFLDVAQEAAEGTAVNIQFTALRPATPPDASPLRNRPSDFAPLPMLSIKSAYIPRISAMVPPDTPGTTSDAPMAKPRANWAAIRWNIMHESIGHTALQRRTG